MKKKTILLLGGTGYIGRHLLPYLASENTVFLITRNISHCDFIKDLPKNISLNINIVSNTDVIITEKKYDWFINLSCSYMKAGDYEVWSSNYKAPSDLLLKINQAGYFPSVLTIGTGLPDNFNIYGFSKKQFYELCTFSNRHKNNKIINVKLENFYGEDEPRNRFLPNVVQRLLKDENIELTEGFQHRDFIYIEDVINGLLAIINYYSESSEQGNFEIPLGTGEAPTVREIVTYCKEITKSKSELEFGAIPLRWNEPDSVADTTCLNKIGFKPKYDWQTGIKIMIERFKV